MKDHQTSPLFLCMIVTAAACMRSDIEPRETAYAGSGDPASSTGDATPTGDDAGPGDPGPGDPSPPQRTVEDSGIIPLEIGDPASTSTVVDVPNAPNRYLAYALLSIDLGPAAPIIPDAPPSLNGQPLTQTYAYLDEGAAVFIFYELTEANMPAPGPARPLTQDLSDGTELPDRAAVFFVMYSSAVAGTGRAGNHSWGATYLSASGTLGAAESEIFAVGSVDATGRSLTWDNGAEIAEDNLNTDTIGATLWLPGAAGAVTQGVTTSGSSTNMLIAWVEIAQAP
ncbi:hypothetical protein ACFL6C_10775 [Myxococcota bacterium]